jgi:hypothetical protein
MNSENVFRPKGNFAWAIVALILDALFLAQVIFYPAEGAINTIEFAIGAAIAVAAYLMWVRPKLVLNKDHLIVVNPISSTKIAYKDIDELETKWALLINHGGNQTRVWVAPANGKQRWIAESARVWKFTRIPSSERVTDEYTTASDSLGSDSGIAAALIRERLRDLH